MEEFNLSEKVSWESLPPRNEDIIDHGVISTIHVKEFIKILKEELCSNNCIKENCDYKKVINQLAGDKLV